MITKDGAIYRAFEGDYHPVNVFVGENKAAGYVSEIAEGQELELEGTYNDSYEGIKIYGKSEQKAKWHQAEGKTGQVVTEQSLNLFSAPSMLTNKYYKYETGEITDITGLSCSSELIAVEPNTTYTLWRSKEAVSGSKSLAVRLFEKNKEYIPDHILSSSGHNIFYFTTTENAYYIGVNNDDPDITVKYGLYKGVYTAQTIPDYTPFTVDSPSPESPSELTSNILAGSYQIPTENGIYEVTLTEDLRGIDDTYRDMIRFDSVSGTGYRVNHVGKKEFDETTSFNTWQRVKNFGFRTLLQNCSVGTPFSDYSLCTHFKNNYELAYGGNDGYFGTGDAWFNGCMDSSEVNNLTQLSAFLQQEKEKGTPVTVYYVLKTPVKEALTFTKVESSSLPVLPWTAYGENLFDGVFESGFYTSEGNAGASNYIRSANYIPVQPNTQYYFKNSKSDDTFLWYDGDKNFISEVGDLSSPSPANARYLRFYFYGTDKTTEYMICSGERPTVYEPFNPTPPESLSVSPDYPQKIYDLSDVTVTSRGRNLFDASQINNIGSGMDKYHKGNGVYSMNYPAYYDFKSCIKDTFPKIEAGSYILSFDCMIPTNTQNKREVKVGIREAPLGAYFNTIQYFTLNENDMWEKVAVPFSVTEESEYVLGIQPLGVQDYSVEVYFKNIQIAKGTYTAETLPPFDKYRCTQAGIGLALPSVKLDNLADGYYTHTDAEGNRYLSDYIYKNGNKVYHVKNIETREFTGNETIGNYVHSGLVNKNFYVFQIFGTSAKTYYEENGIKKHWSYTSMMSSSIPVRWMFGCDGDWCLCTGSTPGNWANNILLGLPKTEVDKMAGDDVNAKGKSYWKSLFENGFSCTVKYIKEPVTTDITDTELGQNLLNLKTAPYYTKLFTDKETGGVRSLYKTFQTSENEVLTGYLLTSDGEYVVTNDGKTVIQF